MPHETLEIGRPPGQSRTATAWRRLGRRSRWVIGAVLAAAIGCGAAASVPSLINDVEPASDGADRPGPGLRPASDADVGSATRPPPWVTGPATTPSHTFTLVNRSSRRILVSTPPQFVFVIPPHGRVVVSRVPVCTYERFTARHPGGPVIGSIQDFCAARRWVLLRPGGARLE